MMLIFIRHNARTLYKPHLPLQIMLASQGLSTLPVTRTRPLVHIIIHKIRNRFYVFLIKYMYTYTYMYIHASVHTYMHMHTAYIYTHI